MPAQSSNRQNVRTEPTPERLLLPGEYRAPEGDELTEQDLAALATERPLVRASGLGDFPGDDLGEAMSRVEGELGAPHLPFLPHLPALGWRSTPLARTLAVCEGLALTVPRLAGAWCIAAAGEHASLPWHRTVCFRISIFSLTVWVRRRRGSLPVLRVPLRCIRFSWSVR